MSDWKMPRDEIERLISLYRQNKCLWDYRSNEYKRTDLKRESWQNLADIFGKEVNVVKRKIKHLRSAYVSEKKKVDEYFGVLPSYRPNLFYYDEMTFLDPIIVLRKIPKFEKFESADSIEELSEQPIDNVTTEEYVMEEEDISPPVSPKRIADSNKKLTKKQHRLAPYYSKLNAAVNTLAEVTKSTSEESIYTAFGTTIALQLSQLSPLDATVTMSEIHQILSKNVIKSMTLKSRGMPVKIKGVTMVDRQLSALIDVVEEEMEADDQSGEF